MPSSLAPNWLLAVTASRAALRAVARDGFATVDPAPTPQGVGACEETEQTRNTGGGEQPA
jgi:hypothetical protein